MKTNHSACGLCKPHKRWKRKDTRRMESENRALHLEIGGAPKIKLRLSKG